MCFCIRLQIIFVPHPFVHDMLDSVIVRIITTVRKHMHEKRLTMPRNLAVDARDSHRTDKVSAKWALLSCHATFGGEVGNDCVKNYVVLTLAPHLEGGK